ncbi:uncharacterized protein LOC122503484 [Leptopilina heterotoma]|uniref:uncharacterized protein LOC122503484 n=1 Tax=Leptopilina heterotoma TaxID=63436 RepID=UPI001CA9F756|nr:uncharacterized protein LOC122503484 [Leptopilina heterotoma]
MKVINIYLVTFIFLRGIQDTSPTNGYIDGLLKHLKEESKLHQVIFIVDDVQNITDPILQSTITSVNSHFPSVIFSYNDLETILLTDPRLEMPKNLYKKAGPSLLVYEMSKLDFDFLFFTDIYQLNGLYYRREIQHKILILNSASSNYTIIERILSTAWRLKYLDFTLLTYSNEQPHKIIKSSSLMSSFLSHLNPFNQNYSHELLSAKSEWFPNKLQNLNGYRLEVDCKSVYDSSEVEYNSSMKLLDILEKAMNFKSNVTQFIDIASKTYFEADNDKKKDILLKNILSLSDLTISLQELFQSNNELNCFCQQIVVLNIVRINVVIPKGLKCNEGIEVSEQIWHMILATICMISVMRLAVFLLKFKKRAWQTLSIFQIVIGMGTSEEPLTLTERTIFGSLLITCIVYTSYFYSVILDVSLKSTPEISTLAELMNTNISVITTLNGAELLYYTLFSQSDVKRWILKEIVYPSGDEETCLKQLSNFQNICCILKDGAYHIAEYEVKYGKLNGKILQETVASGYSTFTAHYLSPYVNRFREIILKASEFGFLEDFYKNIPHVLSDIPKPEEITKDKLLPILLSVLVIGYSLAIIVFLLEVITAKIKSRYSRKKPLYRFVN